MARCKKASKKSRSRHFKKQVVAGTFVPRAPTRPLKERYLEAMDTLAGTVDTLKTEVEETKDFGVAQQYEISQLKELLGLQEKYLQEQRQEQLQQQQHYEDLRMAYQISQEKVMQLLGDLGGLEAAAERDQRELEALRSEIRRLQENTTEMGRGSRRRG